jgi:hypothetical protein
MNALVRTNDSRRCPHLDLHPINVADDFRINLPCCDWFSPGLVFLPDSFQFACIQPIPGAIRAMVHLNFALRIEQVAFQFDTVAARTGAFAGSVHGALCVALDVDEMVAGGFMDFIHAFEFERVEPNSAAASLAHIHGNGADLSLRQLMVTRWAFHGCIGSAGGNRWQTDSPVEFIIIIIILILISKGQEDYD